MSNRPPYPYVHQISVSDGGVPKLPVLEATVSDKGVDGDRQRNLKFHGGPDRAVCLYSLELIMRLQDEGHPIDPGSSGENLTVSGLDWDQVRPGVRLTIGPEVQLEVTSYLRGVSMDRVLEPELMDDPKQADAYASADFAEENQGFVDRFKEYFPEFSQGRVLDLGCGPGDIPIRFATLYPACHIIGVDASAPMIQLGEQAVKQAGLADRITLRCERYEEVAGARIVDAAISNSLHRR
ncbi:MAG: methyltransferase domain-containing protein [Nitrospirae bacterium]|nr:methyltransferase domain-containing protein [Nitrospirota bacterium]